MTVLKKAVIKSYNAAEHKATVQIAGSLGVWLDGVRVATDIPAADVQAGRQCTVLFLDPSNPDDAVVITIQGALPSGGGDGSTTFIGLTDTPASYAGAALQTLRVNAGASAVEFHDPYAAAHTWAALQTFGAGIKLAASQQIKDSGGTGRILLATASPNITLTGATRINDHAAIQCAPVTTSPDTKLNISPITTGVTAWRGISMNPNLTFSGDNRMATAILGLATALGAHGSTGHTLSGLDFIATALANGVTAAFSTVYACTAHPGLWPVAGGTINAADADGFRTTWDNVTQMFGTALNATNLRAFHFPGRTLNDGVISITNAYGLHIEDIIGTSFTNKYLMEIGPATPYLRLLGGGDPAANVSNLLLKLGAALKLLSEGAADSGGAGYRVLRVPN